MPRPASAEFDDEQVATLASRLAGDPRAVVLIDGPSGSGKSTLADRLAAAWPAPVQLVRLDELYPGWDGLSAGSDAVASTLLRPLAPGYRRWDWASGRPADWVALDADAPLIVEGCGALTPANRALATFGIWVDAPEPVRRARALAREPDYAEHWEQWAAQEREHRRRHRPRALADLVVAGP